MGFLFSKLWALFGKKEKNENLIVNSVFFYIGNEEHKIIIVGLDNAGIISRRIFLFLNIFSLMNF